MKTEKRILKIRKGEPLRRASFSDVKRYKVDVYSPFTCAWLNVATLTFEPSESLLFDLAEQAALDACMSVSRIRYCNACQIVEFDFVD